MGKPFHGKPADVWAAGVTLALIVSERIPFEGESVVDLWHRVANDEPNLPAHLSPSLRQLLCSMLSKQPAERPRIAELRQHEWGVPLGPLTMRTTCLPASTCLSEPRMPWQSARCARRAMRNTRCSVCRSQ